jgi:hypothetical protein
MFGGVAQVLNLVIPQVPVGVWVLLLLALTLALLLGGGYERIERLAMIKVGLFTLLTFSAAVILTRQTGFSWRELAGGLRFECRVRVGDAVAVFGSRELARASFSCTRTGVSRRATRDIPERETRPANGSASAWLGARHERRHHRVDGGLHSCHSGLLSAGRGEFFTGWERSRGLEI